MICGADIRDLFHRAATIIGRQDFDRR
jgi:hypothetical protein